MNLQQRRSHKDILRWIRAKGILNNKGSAIEFMDHGFMIDYLKDDANRIVVRKCTQVGATFSTVLKILYEGEVIPINCIYTLPTGPEAKNFVLSKFDPIMARSPGLASLVQKVGITKKELFNTTIKRIGESYYFFRGSWTTWGAQAIDADVLVVDELDFQKEDVRKMFEERIEGSNSKDVIYWLGYPSVPGFGIEELYESSDQRVWYIECPSCHKRQTLSWPESIDMKNAQYICKMCRATLPDEARRRGLWKPTKPGRMIHGYHINKLMAPWVPAARIIDRFQKDSTRKFFNYTLGLPYQGAETELTDKVVESALVSDEEVRAFIEQEKPLVVLGIDQGDEFFVVKMLVTQGQTIVVDYEIFNSEAQLQEYFNKVEPFAIMMDMSPNTHTAKKLQEDFGRDRFYLGDEQMRANSLSMSNYFEVRFKDNRVTILRTESFDELYEYIQSGRVKIRKSMKNLWTRNKQNPGYIDMLKNMVPDVQEKFGRPVRVWKVMGPDHLAHATSFALITAKILYPEFTQRKVITTLDEAPQVPWYIEDFEKAMAMPDSGNMDYTLVLPRSYSRKRPSITPRDINL